MDAFKLIINGSKTRISLAMTKSIPAGMYAKSYLKTIGVWRVLKNNIVESTNVRAAMYFISRGDLDYGIVYKSDVLVEKRVKVIYTLETKFHDAIIYPIASLNKNRNTIRFLEYLYDNKTLNIMSKWGFKIKND